MKVVLHTREGEFLPSVYVDDERVEVIWLDDNVPDDRIYRMSPDSVPEKLELDIATGPEGYEGDDPAKHAKASRAAAEIRGESHLKVIE